LKLDSILYKKRYYPGSLRHSLYARSERTTAQRASGISILPTPHGLYHQSRAILDSDTSALQTSHPTLVVVGKEDLVTPVKFSEQLAQGIPNAELVILDRGHAFVVESAETVVKEMLN